MSATSPTTKPPQALPEREILQAVREVRFGMVEIVVHDGRVMEIRQTKKVRISSEGATPILSDLKSGGLKNDPQHHHPARRSAVASYLIK